MEKVFLMIFILFNACVFLKSYFESKRKNSFGPTPLLFPLGIYVWGDGVVFGLFWTLCSIFCLIQADFILFLLIFSVFHLVRSFGETIYWFLEQFAVNHRNDPKKMLFYSHFKSEAVWFIYQTIHQCIVVATIISSVFLFSLWLKT